MPLANRMRMVGKRLMKAIFYDEGTEYVPWVAGHTSGSGTASKESDHLYLRVLGPQDYRTWVIDMPVDLTKIATLKIDWSKGGYTGSSHARAVFAASTEKDGSYAVYDVRYHVSEETFARRINQIDVSGLEGLYYIRVHAASTGESESREVIVGTYKIWGEDAEGNIVRIPIPRGA